MRFLGTIPLLLVLGAALVATPVHAIGHQSAPPSGAGQSTTTTSTSPTTPGQSIDIVSPETAEFTPLVGLPGITDETGGRTLAGYLNTLFRLAIGIGALIAVIKIIVAGIKYMSSDSFFTTAEAREDIKNSLFGLLLILSTVVLIRLINPAILELNVLQQLAPIEPIVRSTVDADCPPDTTESLTLSSCASDAERRAFLSRCRQLGQGAVLTLQPTTGRYQCFGAQTSSSTAATAAITEFETRYPGAEDAQRRNFIENIVNYVPDNAEEIIAAWRANDPDYTEDAFDVLFVVTPSTDLSAAGVDINTQQSGICDRWNPDAGSGVDTFVHNGTTYQVCAVSAASGT